MAERLLFLALVAVMIVPVWLFTYYPATDGPVHLNIATIMNDYGDAPPVLIERYFQFNKNIEPNVVAHHVLAALDLIFPILTAEKIFITLWALLFCAATRSVVLAVNPNGTVFAYLFLPTVFNYYTQEGYYNFILGMALCFLVLGHWYVRRDRLTLWHMAVLGAIGVLIVWTHLFSFLMLIFLIGLVTTFDYGLRLWHAWRARHSSAVRGLVASYVRRAVALILVFAPAMYFSVSFTLRHGLTEAAATEQDKLYLLKHLLGMSFLFSFDPLEFVFYVPFLVLLVALAAVLGAQRWRERRLEPADAFLFSLICLVGVYMFVPITTKEVAISQRFLAYILAAGIFWLASLRLTRRAAAGIVTAMIVLVAATSVYRTWKYDTYNDLLASYVSAAEHVAPHSTILALHYWRSGWPLDGREVAWRTDPFRHASSYIAMKTGGIDLRSSMMAQSVYGYFPVIYRHALDPYVTIGEDIEATPPSADLLDYTERTGETIDYVLLWAYEGVPADDGIHRQLAEGYEHIYESPDGLVQLYRRRDAGADRS